MRRRLRVLGSDGVIGIGGRGEQHGGTLSSEVVVELRG